MTILVDADACPVKDEIIRAAKKNNIQVHFFADINHRITVDYGLVTTVDQGADSVDIALINNSQSGDIIVTQDYGVAMLALGKGCFVLHPSGRELNNSNIDQLMFERHISREARSRGKRGPKIKKRVSKDNQYFEDQLTAMIMTHCNIE